MCENVQKVNAQGGVGGGGGGGMSENIGYSGGAGPRLSCQFESFPLQVWIQACRSLGLTNPTLKTHRADK